MIELLALVAILAVAFALMAATARHVRSNSAMELTRKRMAALTESASDLMSRGIDPRVPLTFASTTSTDTKLEESLHRYAADSSRRLGEALQERPESLLKHAIGMPELRDAWGRPMALMPAQFPAVGMAPEDGPFLVSAGPDGRFLTLADNIYSYDLPALLPRAANPATNPGLAASEEASGGDFTGPQNDPQPAASAAGHPE